MRLQTTLRLARRTSLPCTKRHFVAPTLARTAAPISKPATGLADAFDFSGSAPPLPQKYSELKKEIVGGEAERLVETWRVVLKELESVTEEVAGRGSDNVPQIPYMSFERGLSEEEANEIKRTGVVIVKGGIPADQALQWKESIREYARLNRDKLRGSPPDNIVFYEIYNSPAQLAARSHPAVLTTQRALLSLWHTRSSPHPSSSSHTVPTVSLTTPISYFDRLRIRPPGPSAFVLGCHLDGGSLERWEDEGYRKCYERVFRGSDEWRDTDWLFDAALRVGANPDLHGAPGQCSVFRPWQGWTSLSSTGPGEGTLRVLPFLNLAAAYIILRPFFRPRHQALRRTSVSSSTWLKDSPAEDIPLGFEDWELNLDGTEFPGSELTAQVLTERTHPHLRLGRTMTSIPRVEPGDQVYWHCDLVHAVESQHTGTGDSSVLYIPAVPLTVPNAGYLRAQLQNFARGLPPADFPGGDGEKHFVGRATLEDIEKMDRDARRVFGVEPYDADELGLVGGAREAVEQGNMIIF